MLLKTQFCTLEVVVDTLEIGMRLAFKKQLGCKLVGHLWDTHSHKFSSNSRKICYLNLLLYQPIPTVSGIEPRHCLGPSPIPVVQAKNITCSIIQLNMVYCMVSLGFRLL